MSKSKEESKYNFGRTKKQVMTDPILSKGHGHPVKRSEPKICPDCKGRCYTDTGMECYTCDGEGEI